MKTGFWIRIVLFISLMSDKPNVTVNGQKIPVKYILYK